MKKISEGLVILESNGEIKSNLKSKEAKRALDKLKPLKVSWGAVVYCKIDEAFITGNIEFKKSRDNGFVYSYGLGSGKNLDEAVINGFKTLKEKGLDPNITIVVNAASPLKRKEYIYNQEKDRFNIKR